MAELTLEIVEGQGAGRMVQLTGPLEVGRDPGVSFHVDDQLVSRKHARITPDAEGAYVEDLDSLNGTLVNGNEIHARTPVKAGDQVQVGVTVLELRSPAQVRAQPTAVRPKPPPLAVPVRTPDYIPPQVLAPGQVGTASTEELDPLLDIYTKAKARTAPLALFVLVALAVLIFLAQAKL